MVDILSVTSSGSKDEILTALIAGVKQGIIDYGLGVSPNPVTMLEAGLLDDDYVDSADSVDEVTEGSGEGVLVGGTDESSSLLNVMLAAAEVSGGLDNVDYEDYDESDEYDLNDEEVSLLTDFDDDEDYSYEDLDLEDVGLDSEGYEEDEEFDYDEDSLLVEDYDGEDSGEEDEDFAYDDDSLLVEDYDGEDSGEEDEDFNSEGGGFLDGADLSEYLDVEDDDYSEDDSTEEVDVDTLFVDEDYDEDEDYFEEVDVNILPDEEDDSSNYWGSNSHGVGGSEETCIHSGGSKGGTVQRLDCSEASKPTSIKSPESGLKTLSYGVSKVVIDNSTPVAEKQVVKNVSAKNSSSYKSVEDYVRAMGNKATLSEAVRIFGSKRVKASLGNGSIFLKKDFLII